MVLTWSMSSGYHHVEALKSPPDEKLVDLIILTSQLESMPLILFNTEISV